MHWLYLFIAGLCEIGWAVGLKYSEGFSKPGISVLTVAGMIVSFVFLALALKKLPIGTAYAVWTGIGAAGTAIFGMIYFHESRDFWRIFCIGLVLCGTLGLKLISHE